MSKKCHMDLGDKMKIIFPLIFASIFINQSHAAVQMKFSQANLNLGSAVDAEVLRDDFIISLVDLKREMTNPDTITYGKVDFFISDNHAIGGQVGFRYPIVLTTTGQSGYDRGAGSMLSRGSVILIKSQPVMHFTHSLSLVL